jgi:hypothetical protein
MPTYSSFANCPYTFHNDCALGKYHVDGTDVCVAAPPIDPVFNVPNYVSPSHKKETDYYPTARRVSDA